MTTNGPDENSSRRSRRHSIRSYVSDLICNASSEDEFDALKIMEKNPEIREHRTLVLDLAYEEFCRKRENGDPIQQRSFAQRFPEYEESLMRVFQVHQYLESFEQKKEKPKVEWPKPGDLFGGYRLLELIGRGSFAFVFIAEQLNVAERKVVLKITRNALDEVATLGRLEHPNIVQIYTVESDVDGFTAICMPLISQVTLFDVVGELHGYGGQPETAEDFVKALEYCVNERDEIALNRAKMPFGKQQKFVDAVLHVGVDVARALTYSHKQKFLHCDIKPTNILVTPDGRSMLFDFNLSAKSNSKTGRIGGTLPYMPPEQLTALIEGNYDFEATTAVDIYSFGVTLYQFLTGKLPFGDVPESSSQKEAAKLLLERQEKTEISFGSVRGINKSLQQTIKKCLAFEPSERPPSAEVLVSQLEREQRTVKRTRRWMITHPIKALVACVFLLSFIPFSILGFNYVFHELPRRAVLELINKGIASEEEHDFNQAIEYYQAALEKADIDRRLRFQTLCRLAIVYARHSKPNEAEGILEIAKQEFPLEEDICSKVELAVIGATSRVKFEQYDRSLRVFDTLEKSKKQSIDDLNNHMSIALRYFVVMKYAYFDRFSKQFQKILDEDPNHFGANYNMFRMIRNKYRTSNAHIEYLDRCLRHGDKSVLLSKKLILAVEEFNKGQISESEILDLVKRYGACGGDKETAESYLQGINDPKIEGLFLEQLELVEFRDLDPDLFIFYGIANPLTQIKF